MSIVCPVECVKSGCPDSPDFLEKHDSFLLTIVASLSACVGLFLSYFLKSRCKKISTPCMSCDRDVLELEPNNTTIEVASA